VSVETLSIIVSPLVTGCRRHAEPDRLPRTGHSEKDRSWDCLAVGTGRWELAGGNAPMGTRRREPADGNPPAGTGRWEPADGNKPADGNRWGRGEYDQRGGLNGCPLRDENRLGERSGAARTSRGDVPQLAASCATGLAGFSA
jgi:hypothetical protein